MSLHDLEISVGLMLHLSFGFMVGRAALAGLIHDRTVGQAMQKSSGKLPSHIFVTLSKEARATVAFWGAFFTGWDRTCPIVQRFSPQCAHECHGMSDASGTGYGGILHEGDAATRVTGLMGLWVVPEESAEFATRPASVVNAPLLEGRAVLHWFQMFAQRCAGRRLLLEIDSSTFVWVLESLYSSNPQLAAIVASIWDFVCRFHICLRVRHVMGDAYNLPAHYLSHGDFFQAQCHAQSLFGLPLKLVTLPPL